MNTPEIFRIFTMTVVSGDPEVRDGRNRLRSHCWGYYLSRGDAEYAIGVNATDMSELGYYKYALLGALGEGPLATGDELQWYEFIWNWDVPPREYDGIVVPRFVGVKEIDKPEAYRNIWFAGL